MTSTITVNNTSIPIKEYNGFRVVTLKEIDAVHGRKDGTARKRFNDNKHRFIEGVDFFKITPSEFRTAIGEMDIRQQNAVTLITESGYLMLVKSFADDLAWQVQRELVSSYFRAKTIIDKQSDPQEEAYTGAQRLGDVVELAKLTARLMKDNKRRPCEILQTVGEQLEQFGVPIPEGFFLGSFTPEGIDRSNTVAAFLAEYGDVTGEAVTDVYDAYLNFCSRTGNRPIPTTRGFGSEIVKQTGIHTKTQSRGGKYMRVYTV